MTSPPADYIPPESGRFGFPARLGVPSSRGRAPLGIAAFLAIPLFFCTLMASTLAQEKPIKHQWQHAKACPPFATRVPSGLCTTWAFPSAGNEARIWAWALLPPLILVAIGWLATRLPLGFYLSCLASIVLAMGVVHDTAKWAAHHAARFPLGVDLIPASNAISDQYSRGEWEKMALSTALSFQHWTIGVALAASTVMALVWFRSQRKARRPGAVGMPHESIHAQDITTPGV